MFTIAAAFGNVHGVYKAPGGDFRESVRPRFYCRKLASEVAALRVCKPSSLEVSMC